ncbi:transport and Golgi organization 2 homolog isoform X2 [Glandiceps talaboti]
MCLLFLKLDPNPPSDGYKLILASNRDETLDRPTKPADWWVDNSNILSGLDQTQGKVGGTWLGITRTGKFATLLNILSDVVDPNAKGRGSLISNFLKGNDESLSYLQQVSSEGELYNAFNLLVCDLTRMNSQSSLGYYSNKTGKDPELLSPGIHGLCNSTIDKPWKKCVIGKDRFTDIVNGATIGDKEKLMDHLVELMSDQTPHPDQAIGQMCAGSLEPKLQEDRSAIYVHSPGSNYGTRTHTIILVDASNKVTYLEKTLTEPIDEKNFQWTTNMYNFDIQNNQ